MIVGHALAVVAEEEVEALLVGRAGRAGIAQAPFADAAGRVAGLLERLRERRRPRRKRRLALGLDFEVVPDVGMPGVKPVSRTQREGAQTGLPE